MKKLLMLLILLIAGTAGTAFAQNGTLKAKFIRSNNNQPYMSWVYVYSENNALVTQQRPDSNGILIYNLPAGNYKMNTKGNYIPWTSPLFTVTTNDTNKQYFDNPVSLVPLGYLKAKFLKSTTGEDLKNKSVYIYTSANTYVAQPSTDSMGILQYKLEPGNYKLVMNSVHYMYWSSIDLTISSDDTNKYYFDNPASIIPKGVVKAKIIRSTDGLPYKEQVQIYTAAGAYVAQIRVDTSGVFQYNLAADSYKIKLYTSNYEPWTSSDFTITSGDTNKYYFDNPVSVIPLGVLKAKFVNILNGQPYTYPVRIYTSNGTYVAQPSCNSQGVLEYKLKAGSYKVHLYSAYFDPWSSGDLTITAGDTNTYHFINPVYVTPRGIFLAKFLRSTDSWPYTDWIRLYKEDGTYISQVKPNASGVYQQILTAGGYKVMLYTSNYHGWTSPVFYLTAGDTNRFYFDNPVMVQPITGTLKAKFVRSIDSLPVGPVQVMLKHISPMIDSQVVTLDSNGVFNQPVQIGNYIFKTLASNNYGYQTFVSDTVTVSTNQTNEILYNSPVRLDLTTGIIKAKFLCNTTGLPVGAIQLMLRQTAPVVDSQIVTLNDSGMISINVQPGEYQFTNDQSYQNGYKDHQSQIISVNINSISRELLDIPDTLLRSNYELVFDGEDDYIICDNHESLNFTNSMTAEFWVKFNTEDTVSSYQSLIYKVDTCRTTENGFKIRKQYSNLIFEIFNRKNKLTHSCYMSIDNKWHHIAVVFYNPYSYIYIDGILRDQKSNLNMAIGLTNAPLTIARSVSLEHRTFKGSMDEIRLWNVTRSPLEIINNMNKQLSGQETGLVANYSIEEGSGTIINDIAGHNSQGTFYGNVSWQEGLFPHTSGGITKASDNGNKEPVVTAEIPQNFALDQNYPNPFNPTTTIKYALKEDVKVSLKIYNALGQEVRTLVDDKQSAGFKQVMWDGKNNQGNAVPSGIYIYRIVAGNFVKSNKMMMIK